jgi:hypothetical protein
MSSTASSVVSADVGPTPAFYTSCIPTEVGYTTAGARERGVGRKHNQLQPFILRICRPGRRKLRKTPCRPRSWPNSSLLYPYSHGNARANLHRLGRPDTLPRLQAQRGVGGGRGLLPRGRRGGAAQLGNAICIQNTKRTHFA